MDYYIWFLVDSIRRCVQQTHSISISIEKGVTVVKAQTDHAASYDLDNIFRQRFTNMSQGSDVMIARFASIVHVLIEQQHTSRVTPRLLMLDRPYRLNDSFRHGSTEVTSSSEPWPVTFVMNDDESKMIYTDHRHW